MQIQFDNTGAPSSKILRIQFDKLCFIHIIKKWNCEKDRWFLQTDTERFVGMLLSAKESMICYFLYKKVEIFVYFLEKQTNKQTKRGTWMALSVQQPTLDFSSSCDLGVVGRNPTLGSVLGVELLKILSFSLVLALTRTRAFCPSPSLKKSETKNKSNPN